jgi:protein tyrosine phosphatase (PTP) superfamily phosphohydrolase (DUF442 family)
MGEPRAGRARTLTLVFFLWLTAGFSLGTLTLLGPVRWIVSHARSTGWSQHGENAAIVAVIVLLVLASGLAAFRLAQAVLTTRRRLVAWGVPLALFVCAALMLHLWLNPELLGASFGPVTESGPRFTFGPYPDENRLRELKSDGFTAVISLLHPAVVPFEPKLIADEEAAAARAGIELLRVPMLPWISDNAAAIERIRGIVAEGRGRYYVHCYLGMDRIQLVRRVVEQADARVELPPGAQSATLRGIPAFERGAIEELEDGVFLAPLPTESEILRYVIPAGVKTVVCLLDPDDAGDREWIAKEREQLSTLAVPFALYPVPDGPKRQGKLGDAVRAVRAMPRPVLVHAFLAPASGKLGVADAFADAYRKAMASP